MPYRTPIDCPACEQPLLGKSGGRCSNCGEVVNVHVARARLREQRAEKAVAVLATALVLALFVWAGVFDLLVGIAIYALAGLAVWYWGKGTFWTGGS